MQNKLIIFISIILFSNFCFSDVLKKEELLPIETGSSLLIFSNSINDLNFSINNFKEKNTFNTVRNSKQSIGYLNRNKIRYAIDIYSEENISIFNNRTEDQKEIVKNLKFSFLTRKKSFWNGSLEGFGYISFTPNSNINFDCINFENVNIGGKKSDCYKNNNLFYESEKNNISMPAVSIKRNKRSIGFGLKNTWNSWKNKTVFSLISSIENVNSNIILGNGFSNVDNEIYINSFPKSNHLYSKIFETRVVTSRIFFQNWSYAFSFSNFINNYENSIKLKRNNLVGFHLTKKFENNLFLNINNSYTSNYLIGIDNFFYGVNDNAFIRKPYNEFEISIGYLFSNKLNSKDIQINEKLNDLFFKKEPINKLTLNNSTSNNMESLAEKSSIKSNDNSFNNNDEPKQENLLIYALDFAKKIDQTNKKIKLN